MYGLILYLGLVATTIGTVTTAEAVAPKLNASIADIKDFHELFAEREILIDTKRQLELDVSELTARINGLPTKEELQRRLARFQENMEAAKKANVQPEFRDSLQRTIDATQQDIASLDAITPALRDKRSGLEGTSRRLLAVEQRIASLFDAASDTNRFRAIVTFTFGVLVFFVIVGFYLIAWYKHVATTIFSGEMGMQFVTLFLIVIAIILFGIMGTLEGKELSALLGGLSGYILGRASETRRASSTPSVPIDEGQTP